MKIITKANFTKVTLFATVLLAGCFFAGAANAQTVQGTFTLDHAARWGKTVLPAGDYRLKLDPGADPAMAVISDATSGKRVAIVACSGSPKTAPRATAPCSSAGAETSA